MSLFPDFRAFPRTCFVDMNAFYTSVEQQECEAYRGRPAIVVPVLADTTCAIAASYEAQARGIKAGTSVKLARLACPEIHIVEARPQLYLDYHARLVQVLNEQFATVKVLSIDEMACRIPLVYKTARDEETLAGRVKARIGRELGPHLRCSIGIGPNVFLAKVASDRWKPDGLTIFDETNLPDALLGLKLGDLPGIGSAMKRRLTACGIPTVEALWNASPLDLRRAWGSVVGERWYYMLRGSHEADYQGTQPEGRPRKTVGHSNVLAPEHRTLEGTKRILLELFGKALKRLRAYQQVASAMQVTVRYRKRRGTPSTALPFSTPEGLWVRRSRGHLHANDESTWLKALRPLLDALPDLSPTADPGYVGIVFSGLLACRDLNLSLFEDAQEKVRLTAVVDDLNRKYGRVLDVAPLAWQPQQIPLRIPYGAPDRIL